MTDKRQKFNSLAAIHTACIPAPRYTIRIETYYLLPYTWDDETPYTARKLYDDICDSLGESETIEIVTPLLWIQRDLRGQIMATFHLEKVDP